MDKKTGDRCEKCFCVSCVRFGTSDCADGDAHCVKCKSGQEMKYCLRRPGARLPNVPTAEEMRARDIYILPPLPPGYCPITRIHCEGPYCPNWTNNPVGCKLDRWPEIKI